LWLFGGTLFGDRLLYFRDLSGAYAPDYEFLSRSLREGIWPLWNPYVDGGSPCLFAYPVDLLLIGLLGPRSPLGWGAAFHVYVALCGASVLANRLGRGPSAAWLAGVVYGLSGFVLSSVNLLQLLYAAAWAPWLLAAFLGVLEKPSGRRTAILAALAALQASTLGADVIVQTALAVPFLVPWRRIGEGAWVRLAQAAVAAALLAAPVIAGVLWLVQGTARGQGFTASQALGYSASPVVLLDSVLPRFFGDVHAFSDVGYWGQPFFPNGYPYLLSLYVGPLVLLLALAARPSRLHLLLALGVLASLGSHGPLGLVLSTGLPFLRGPIKYFFLVTLAAALLASQGLERLAVACVRMSVVTAMLAFGLGLVGLAAVVGDRPDRAAFLFGGLIPELMGQRALFVAKHLWSVDWLATGGLCLGAGLLALRSARFSGLLGLMVAIDLLIVNGALNPLTPSAFYSLRPAMAEVVREAEREGRFRWFSYGAANSSGVRWNQATALKGSDVWLYYVDRQALLPRTQAFDGLEGAFDVDRAGWAPTGSTLAVAEMSPALFAGQVGRMRLANVRWIVSFDRLPEEVVRLRREVAFPELLVPLLLYELRDPLPRAFVAQAWPVSEAELRPSLQARVEYSRPDPHHVVVRVDSPPGTVVVLDPSHSSWGLVGPDGTHPTTKALGRYIAFPTPGGEQVFTLRLDPAWRFPALVLTSVGLLVCLVLIRRPSGTRPVLDTVEPAR
jgi:catechol 2,3-dioxygenase-like lactoylglutathione lyase family enzyme